MNVETLAKELQEHGIEREIALDAAKVILSKYTVTPKFPPPKETFQQAAERGFRPDI